MDELFITTASIGLSEEDRLKQPHAAGYSMCMRASKGEDHTDLQAEH